MIDSREIRPGNWIIKKETDRDTGTTGYDYHEVAADEYFSTFSNVCFPIKLSGEIMAKISFQYSLGDWYKNIDSEGIGAGLPFLRYKQKTNLWYLYNHALPAQPKYLHQLQNLYYSLTNKELHVAPGKFIEEMALVPHKLVAV